MKYGRILRAVREQAWAMTAESFEAMLEILSYRLEHGRLTAEEIEARVGDRQPGVIAAEKVGPVAVLPLHGQLSQRMNLFSMISGGTSTEMFGKAFDDAMADQDVQAIVIDIDSPGGSVNGVEELAQKIFNARGAKPIVAVADSLAASAAYWIGSQANQFVASPSSQVGSIGIVMTHTDVSKSEEMQGVKTSLVKIPAGKMAVNPYEPMTDDTRELALANLAPFYDLFVKAVARGRGVSASEVKDGYGQGGVLAAIPARDAGMVDRIDTLASTVARLSTPQGRRAALNARASDAGETTDQEPTPATSQESQPLWRELNALELDTL
jgi:signal peptide peptidase SppA